MIRLVVTLLSLTLAPFVFAQNLDSLPVEAEKPKPSITLKEKKELRHGRKTKRIPAGGPKSWNSKMPNVLKAEDKAKLGMENYNVDTLKNVTPDTTPRVDPDMTSTSGGY